MILRAPMVITSRLMAGVHIGEGADLCEISIQPSGKTDHRGAPRWSYFLDIPFAGVNRTREHTGDDLAGWGDAREMLGTLLSFLTACTEARSYRQRTGRDSENEDLFPDYVAEWAQQHSYELSMLSLELEEN